MYATKDSSQVIDMIDPILMKISSTEYSYICSLHSACVGAVMQHATRWRHHTDSSRCEYRYFGAWLTTLNIGAGLRPVLELPYFRIDC